MTVATGGQDEIHGRHHIRSLRPSIIVINRFLSAPLSATPDPCCFCAIINEDFSEPGMFKCGLGRYSLLRIIDKDLAKKVKKQLVESDVWRYDILMRVSRHFSSLGH